MKDNVLEVPVEQIQVSKWDVRRYGEKKGEFEALVECIKNEGLWNPLTVLQNGDKYTLVAGRRRFKAAQKLGYKTVPVFIQGTESSQLQQRKVTLFENLHRREINDTEKGFGILAMFMDAGYTAEQAITGVKSIDNWLKHHRNNKTDWDSVVGNSVTPPSDPQTNPLLHDPKFISLARSVGYSPKYQYQKLQYTRDLSPEALAEAEKLGISGKKKTILTRKDLRAHPQLQFEAVSVIAGMTDKEAETYVCGIASDLRSGRIEQSGKGYVVNDGKSRRSKSAEDVVKRPSDYYLDIIGESKKLLRLLTSRALSKGEIEYTEDMILDAGTHQLSIIKSLTDKELIQIDNALYIVTKAITQMLKLMDQEFETRDLKKEMMSR